MDLYNYFENTKGFGVLSTSDQEGRVDAAVYSRPHIIEDGTMAFIMNDRLSHHNLQSNPHATYLFREDRLGYEGKRFFLTKVKEEQDSPLIHELQRRTYPPERQFAGPKFLVYFKIAQELPLIGPEKEA
jgi:hypothetical protein